MTLFDAKGTLGDVMGRKLVKFGTAKEVTNPGEDFRSFLFPFYVLPTELVGAPEEFHCVTNHRLIVVITNQRLPAWKLNDGDLLKVLFEFGQREVAERVRKGSLESEVKLLITTETHSAVCPLDPQRIREPKGAALEVEEARRIGFK